MFVLVYVLPAVDTKFLFNIGRAGYNPAQCISKDNPALHALMVDFRAALQVALQGALAEMICFAIVQIIATGSLFFDHDPFPELFGCCSKRRHNTVAAEMFSDISKYESAS